MGGGNSKNKRKKKVEEEHLQKKADKAQKEKEQQEKKEHAQRTEETKGGGKSTGYFIDAGEGERFYVLHVPPGGDKDMPVVVFLHDAEGNAWKSATSDTNWCALADEKKFVVAFPEAKPESDDEEAMHMWNMRQPMNEMEYLDNVVRDAKGKCSIDTKKVFYCGYSGGGLLTNEVAASLSDSVAAICNIMGGVSTKEGATHIEDAKRPVPLYVITGATDNMKVNCELAKTKYEAAGWQVKFEELADTGHVYPADKEGAIWEWFVSCVQ